MAQPQPAEHSGLLVILLLPLGTGQAEGGGSRGHRQDRQWAASPLRASLPRAWVGPACVAARPHQIFPAELPEQTQIQDAPGWLVGSCQPVRGKSGEVINQTAGSETQWGALSLAVNSAEVQVSQTVGLSMAGSAGEPGNNAPGAQDCEGGLSVPRPL